MAEKKTFAFPNEDLQLFPQPDQIQHILSQLVEDQLSGLEFLHLWPKLKSYFKESSEPERLLICFSRVCNRMFNPATFYKQLNEYEHFQTILFKILESSDYLTDILTRHPEYFYWLCTTGINKKYFDTSQYEQELNSIQKRTKDQNRFVELLKSFKRREILRIGIKDLLQQAPLEETVLELSILTDAILQCSLTFFETCFEAEYGKVDTPFCIVALGKLGGNELNYSSDIDLIYLYKDEGEIKHNNHSKQSFHEYYNKLAENLTNFMGKIQEGESLFRVDTRLRPDGDAGPLVRSKISMTRYYETRGKLWERQMLIKARPVAGDLKFGQTFLQELVPFIYPKTYFYSPTEEIAKIKSEIEEKISTNGGQENNIKLMAGGIRDIEFIAQGQQLIHGGKKPTIRDYNTLSTLQKLQENSILAKEEFSDLKGAYILFRKIEHFQQLASGKQTHLLPSDEKHQKRLSHYLEFQNWKQFEIHVDKTQQTVRDIFNHFFNISEEEFKKITFNDFIKDKPSKNILEQLKQFGFQNSIQIHRDFNSIFSAIPEQKIHQEHHSINQFLEKTFKQISQLPNQDQVINRLTQIIISYGSHEHFIQLLTNQPVFLQFVLDLCVFSPVLVRILQLEKKYFSLIFTSSKQIKISFKKQTPKEFLNQFKSDHFDDFLLELTKVKNQSWLSIGILFLKGYLKSQQTWLELTNLADWILSTLILRLSEENNLSSKKYAIFAFGKLGGYELNFGSDLDIVCVYSEEEKSIQNKLTKFIEQLSKTSSQISPLGFLYQLDFRLRPEGENSPLVISNKEYLNYFKNRAQLWEKQAHLKFRFIAGHSQFGKSFQRKVTKDIFTNFKFKNSSLDEILNMRYKIETEKGKLSKKINIKIDKGGLVDIEFLSQIGGFLFPEKSNFNTPLSTITGLDILKSEKIISNNELDFFQSFYLHLRNIESYLTLTFEKSKPEIPSDENQLKQLAYCLQQNDHKIWLETLQDNMNKMRELFLEVSARIRRN